MMANLRLIPILILFANICFVAPLKSETRTPPYSLQWQTRYSTGSFEQNTEVQGLEKFVREQEELSDRLIVLVQHFQDVPISDPELAKAKDRIVQKLSSMASTALAYERKKGEELPKTEQFDRDLWSPTSRIEDSPADLIQSALRPTCWDTSSQSAACPTLFDEAIKLGDMTWVVKNAVVEDWQGPVRDEYLEDTRRRIARWNQYFYHTQFQTPLELAINHALEKRFHSAEPKKEGYKSPRRVPPEWHGIWLHPNVGFLYAPDLSEGDRFAPALLVQWVGFQRWDYTEENTIENLWGLSVVSTLADLPGSTDMGWGGMIHYQRFGLAITDHDGSLALTINLRLSDWLFSHDSSTIRRYSSKFLPKQAAFSQ